MLAGWTGASLELADKFEITRDSLHFRSRSHERPTEEMEQTARLLHLLHEVVLSIGAKLHRIARNLCAVRLLQIFSDLLVAPTLIKFPDET